MSVEIPEFTEAQRERVAEVLRERYGKDVVLELAEREVQLDPETETLTACPTLYWHERGAHFVVFRVAPDRYRCQFYYGAMEQYGTSITEYVDLQQCVLMLLRIQSDHERARADAAARATAPERDEYRGPEII